MRENYEISEIERRFAVAAQQPMNRAQRRQLIKDAKRAGLSLKGRKGLVKQPLDLGVKQFKRYGPKGMKGEYKDYAWEAHKQATEPLSGENKVPDVQASGKRAKATKKARTPQNKR